MTTTDAKQALTQAALDARDLWGQDTAKGLLTAMREAGASVGQTVEMVAHLRGLKATEGAVIALTEWTLDHGVPSKTEARHITAGWAQARRTVARPAASVPAMPALGAVMVSLDRLERELAQSRLARI